MSQGAVMVADAELARFIGDALVAKGARAADAAAMAESLVWANLRGIDSHGVSRLPQYLKMIAAGEIDVKAQPRLVHGRAATFVLDGGLGFGPPAMMQAIELAAGRAHAAGVCFGLLRETTHTGAVGRYAQWIAQRGCAALIMVAGPAFVAYHGARAASLGTSPIAIAVPSGRGPIVLDMATSMIANGKIMQARASGERLPPDAALTAEGEPTTDPRAAAILLPLGGAKGSGLALMFEMLASVLSSAPIVTRALGPQQRRRRTQNCAIVAVDIEAFRPLADFSRDADALAALIKALPPRAGFDEILLPGERGGRIEAARRRDGIPIPAKLAEELAAIAASLAVTPIGIGQRS